MSPLIYLAALIAGLVAIGVIGRLRWRARTRELQRDLDAHREKKAPAPVDFSELESVPPPVRRYLRAVLQEGRPIVTAVRLRHTGTFNMAEDRERWRPFRSEQRVVTRRPGFVWDARIAMMTGLGVRVHDAYVAGEGLLHAALLGLVAVTDQHGRGGMARGELMRFLAEAAWYPTALLPSQGVAWEAVDDRSARGTLTDGDVSVTLLFTFGDDALLESVRAEARERSVGDGTVATPWLGRFRDYEERGGMRIPLDGEVAWILPEGERPYWRGRIAEIGFEP